MESMVIDNFITLKICVSVFFCHVYSVFHIISELVNQMRFLVLFHS